MDNIRETELQQKVDRFQAKFNAVENALVGLMKMYEEMIIFTDKWDEMVEPYLRRDPELVAKRRSEVKRINEGLKVAKQKFRSTMNG